MADLTDTQCLFWVATKWNHSSTCFFICLLSKDNFFTRMISKTQKREMSFGILFHWMNELKLTLRRDFDTLISECVWDFDILILLCQTVLLYKRVYIFVFKRYPHYNNVENIFRIFVGLINATLNKGLTVQNKNKHIWDEYHAKKHTKKPNVRSRLRCDVDRWRIYVKIDNYHTLNLIVQNAPIQFNSKCDQS